VELSSLVEWRCTLVNKNEVKWVVYFSLVLFLVTSIPYLLAYQQAGSQWSFTGFVFGVEDGNTYIAKMLSGANGAFLFKTPYTTMEQNGFLAFFPYLMLGKLTSIPGQHEQLVALFHLFRGAGIIFLSIVIYYFVSLFIENEFYRKLALILAMIGGGTGWVSLFWGGGPSLEIYSPETFGFLSVYGLPHLLFSRALMLLGLYAFLTRKRSYITSVWVGGLWFLMGFFQPMSIPIAWVVLGAYLGVWLVMLLVCKDKRIELSAWFYDIKRLVVIVLISAPWVVYNYLSFLFDPYLKGWYAQNIILSPSPVDYLLSFAILLPLALWGGYHLIKENNQNGYLLIGWLISFPVLVYLPTNVQRRLADGFWVAFVILMLLPLAEKKILKRRYAVLGALPLGVGALILFTGGIWVSIHPDLPIFIPRDEMKVFEYLETHIQAGDVVLADKDISNPLPAWVNGRVVSGHGPESVHYQEANQDIKDFFLGTGTNRQAEIIRKYGVKYVVSGVKEKDLAEKNLINGTLLNSVFETGDYAVFQVTSNIK
jgi:hypothetical protein